MRTAFAPFLLLLAATATAQSVLPRPALLVLNKNEAMLAIVDPATGQVAHRVATGDGPHEIEVSLDGRFAYVSNYGGLIAGSSLSVIDLAAMKEIRRIDLKNLRRPHGIAVSGEAVYFTAEGAGAIGRLDNSAQRVEWTFATGQDVTHMIAASRDGSRLFTANMGSDNISIIERETSGEWSQSLVRVGAGPEGLDLSPDARELWTAHSRDGGISIIAVESKQVVATIDARTRRSNRLKFTPDGRRVLVSDLGGGELIVLDAQQRIVIKRLAVGRGPSGILVTPDGSRAYVALSGDDRIAVVDLKTLAVTGTIATGQGPDGMAWVR